jgi:hypothetical protein
VAAPADCLRYADAVCFAEGDTAVPLFASRFAQGDPAWQETPNLAVRMPDGIVLIGPHQPDVNFGGLGEMVKQVALRMMIGSEFDSAIGIERVELGSLELMARYMVWTNREEIAKKLVDQQAEDALRAWPLKLPPVVKFSPNGLEIKYQGQRLYKEQDLYALVKLGSTLLDSAYQIEKGN